MYTCILNSTEKFEKQETFDTLKQAEKWAILHSRIVPDVTKYTVTIYKDSTLVSIFF